MPLHVVGHKAIIERFSTELPFNIVLVGASGIGKKRLAKYLAQQLSAPFDILSIEAETGDKGKKKPVSINQIRECGKFISTHPFSSPYKIVLIDAVLITEEALQALLRMLEESPNRVRFILYTSGTLPLTILSRCVKVQVSPLSNDEVLEVLEKLGFTSDMAQVSARLSKGSVEKALSHINDAERRRAVLTVMQLIVNKKIPGILVAVRKWKEAEINECIKWFEDLLLAPYGCVSSYTHKELAVGASFAPEDIDRYLKLLRTPMKPSLKMSYMAIRILERY
jgi:DNA polymerase III delta prime subunit